MENKLKMKLKHCFDAVRWEKQFNATLILVILSYTLNYHVILSLKIAALNCNIDY